MVTFATLASTISRSAERHLSTFPEAVQDGRPRDLVATGLEPIVVGRLVLVPATASSGSAMLAVVLGVTTP